MNRFSRFILVFGILALTGLAACETPVDESPLYQKAEFWQRSDTSSAIYMRGPKAQQMLHRDMARCVTEIKELERLGTLKRPLPYDPQSTSADPNPPRPDLVLAEWETPERDGMLLAEDLPYHDFETCMIDKGWERIEHVPYDIAKKARDTYLKAIKRQERRTKSRPHYEDPGMPKGDFDTLNN